MHKIVKNIITKIEDEGLKFPDFEAKAKSLKLSWVK